MLSDWDRGGLTHGKAAGSGDIMDKENAVSASKAYVMSGKTLGYTAGQKLHITRSEGCGVEGSP